MKIQCAKCGTQAPKMQRGETEPSGWKRIMRWQGGHVDTYWECPRCFAAVIKGESTDNVGLPLFEAQP